MKTTVKTDSNLVKGKFSLTVGLPSFDFEQIFDRFMYGLFYYPIQMPAHRYSYLYFIGEYDKGLAIELGASIAKMKVTVSVEELDS